MFRRNEPKNASRRRHLQVSKENFWLRDYKVFFLTRVYTIFTKNVDDFDFLNKPTTIWEAAGVGYDIPINFFDPNIF